MKSTVRLTYFDVLYISLDISVLPEESEVRRVTVKDRHDTEVVEQLFDSPSRLGYVTLDRVLRSRFPLFLEVELSDGTVHKKEKTGPIFPAPTQEEYTDGVRLPLHALDVSNDPVIRELRERFTTGLGKKSAIDRSRQRMMSSMEQIREQIRTPVLMAGIFGAATMIILGVPNASLFSALAPAIGFLLFVLWVARQAFNASALNRKLSVIDASAGL